MSGFSISVVLGNRKMMRGGEWERGGEERGRGGRGGERREGEGRGGEGREERGSHVQVCHQ